jgi:hypothetical protein
MPHFSDAAANGMLDSRTVNLVSLHTGHPGTDGLSNEVSGGSPAYARKAITMAAAASRARAASTQPIFDVPAASNVVAIGFWEDGAPDVFQGWSPNGPANNRPVAATADAASDVIRSEAHGLVNNDRVFLFPVGASSLPAGLSETVLYHVVGVATDTFQVSLTQGGAAVDVTADGGLAWQKCVVETFAQQGTHTVAAAELRL